MLKFKGSKFIAIALIAALLMLFSAGSASAIGLNETGDGEMSALESIEVNSQASSVDYSRGTFQDIQNAIDNAREGSTVVLDKNEYVGNGQSIILAKSVSIAGKSGMKPIIDGKELSRILYIGEKADNLKISNLKFNNGEAHLNKGAAMFIYGTDIEIVGCEFNNNHGRFGGAIFSDDARDKVKDAGNRVRLVNCSFYGNSADLAGGAVGLFGDDVDIINCTFESNGVNNKIRYDSAIYGGAIQLGRINEVVKSKCVGCLFRDNYAISPEGFPISHGGAGCVRAGVAYVNCTFISNRAGHGGALTYHDAGTIDGCIFINNTAIDDYGGALSAKSLKNMDLLIENSRFIGNRAPDGGACYMMGDEIGFSNCTFDSNFASLNGGAVFIKSGSTEIRNSRIANNAANVNGGGIYINALSSTVSGCEFINNEAIPNVKAVRDGLGGAIYVNSSQAVISDSIFTLNTARNGSAVYIDRLSRDVRISGNAMSRNQAWAYSLPLLLSSESILYGDEIRINSTIYGGNNVARYLDPATSNSIYNDANAENVLINGISPVLGATDCGKLYQDDREYDMDILVTVVNEKGEAVYNSTLSSDVYGNVEIVLPNLDAGDYRVYSTHSEDTYYKEISNSTAFSVIPNADVQIYKAKQYPQYNYGDLVLWNLTVRNRGPSNATNVVVSDLLPEGLVWVWDDSEGRFDPQTGLLNLEGIGSGESFNLLIITKINRTGLLVNHANISSEEYDYDLDNNNASEMIFVNPAADIEISKTVDNPNPKFGEEVTFTIFVVNNGPDVASGVAVRDLLPEGLVWIEDNGYGDYNPVTGIWTIGAMDVTELRMLSIRCLVNRTGTLVNSANATAEEYDHDLENNNASSAITVSKSADLAIKETISNQNPDFNDHVTIVIEAANNGPNNGTGVIVKDLLPEALAWIGDDGNGDYNPETGIWNIGNLAVGESKKLTITAIANKTGTFVNQANVSGNEHDYDLENNNDSKTLGIRPAADLEAIKTVNNTNPKYMDWIRWTVEIRNNGPDTAHNVNVTERIPDGLAAVKWNSTCGSYDLDGGLWTIDSVNPNEVCLLDIYCIVNRTGEFINAISALADEYDWNSSNNDDMIVISTEKTIDLAIEAEYDNSNPDYREHVVMTLTASNKGPDNATGVRTIAEIPNGLIPVSNSPDFDGRIWNIGNLAAGETKRLAIIFSVNRTGKMEGAARISGNEIELNLEDNEAFADLNVRPAVDLEISKRASKISYDLGEFIEYIVSIKNNGPDVAHNVSVVDMISPAMSFASYSADIGAFANNGALWTVDRLESQQSATLSYRVLAERAGSVANRASAACEEFDYNLDNNFKEVVSEVSDLLDISKSNETGSVEFNISGLNEELMEVCIAKASNERIGLEKTGSPIAVLAFALMLLIPFGFGYFSKK